MTFELFYHLHFEFIYRFALSYLFDKDSAEDVVQEVFLIVHRNFDRLQTHENIRGWLVKTAKNIANNQALRYIVTHAEPVHFDDHGVSELIACFPPQYAQLLHDYYLYGLTTSELARKNDIATSTVYVRLFRARAMLREALPDQTKSEKQEGGIPNGIESPN